MWNIIHFASAVTDQWPKTMSNLSNIQCLLRSRGKKMWKGKISTICCINHKAGIFVCCDVKYHKCSCCSHGTMMINIGQPFEFAVSNSAPIASALKTLYDTRGTFGPILPILVRFQYILVHYGIIISWSCRNEPRHYCYRTEIGKIVPIVSTVALPVSRALA